MNANRVRVPLIVRNPSRGAELVTAGKVADNSWTRMRGLIGSRPLQLGEGLLIVPGGRIHTHWMGFPIDVLYLDKERRVVGMDHNLRPWRLGGAYRKVHYVLELPANMLKDSGTEVGDQIEFDGY